MKENLIAYLEFLRDSGVEVIPRVNLKNKALEPADLIRSADEKQSLLDRLWERDVKNCRKCNLWVKRRKIVFGEGNPSARIVFVGEAPGEEEDKTGKPFVGKAGQLLTKMIKAMNLEREDVYICNVLKCRPPGNRDPKNEEIERCRGYLEKQIEIINPEVIVTLGRHSFFTLTGEGPSINAVHGTWKKYKDIDLLPTFHPSYLLRNANAKKLAWQDLKKVMKRLGISVKK